MGQEIVSGFTYATIIIVADKGRDENDQCGDGDGGGDDDNDDDDNNISSSDDDTNNSSSSDDDDYNDNDNIIIIIITPNDTNDIDKIHQWNMSVPKHIFTN